MSTSLIPQFRFIFSDLEDNDIGFQGCMKLSQAKWPTLRRLYLKKNGIEDEGCLHLSRGQWPMLQLVNVDENEISSIGQEYLSEGRWPLLKQLSMNNKMAKQKLIKCFYFVYNLKPFDNSSDLPFYNILTIDFQNNAIETIQSLTRLKAPFLQKLYLSSNRITKLNGLFKLHSKQLKELYLSNNVIISENNEFNQLSDISTMNTNQVQILEIIEYKRFSMRPLLKCELNSRKQSLKTYFQKLTSQAFERKCQKQK